MKNRFIVSSLLVGMSCSLFFCNNTVKSEHTKEQKKDSIIRPSTVSQNASLVNLGFIDLPVYQWVEYAGKFVHNGSEYPHIYGFKFFDEKGKLVSTDYYENMAIRNGSKDFDASKSKVRLFPGNATIEVSNDVDTLLFFYVLESDEFKRTYQGVEYVNMPAVYFEKNYDIGFRSDEDIEFNIRKEGDTYIVKFTGTDIPFKMSSTCTCVPEKISFLNEEEGRIYFIEKDCYLELVNAEDSKVIQVLTR